MKKTKLNMTIASALMAGSMVAGLGTSAQAAPSEILAGSTLSLFGPTSGRPPPVHS